MLLPTLEGGGAERVMVTLAHAFLARGLQVDLVVFTASGPYRKGLLPELRLIDLGSVRAVRSLGPLVRYLRTERPSCMLSTLGQANVIAIAARAIAAPRMRLVVREANTLSVLSKHSNSLRDRLIAQLSPTLYRHADAVIAPSRGVADDLQRMMRNSKNPVVVIPNPIDSMAIRQQAAAPLDHPWIAAGVPIVLAVGRLSAQKDLPTLLEAFAQVLQHRDARLLILGDGEERAKLEQRVREKGLSAVVDLHGFADNPFSYMARAAVYVLSSRFEGLPNALLQALAVGTPTVATDCPSGPREILEGGRWGRLVPMGDPIAMAAAIAASLDADVRSTMPPELFEARYGIEGCVNQYLEVLCPTTGGR